MIAMKESIMKTSGRPFLTDGGLETTLIFHHGVDLPEFAAFHLLRNQAGRRMLADYLVPYLETASAHGAGFLYEAVFTRMAEEG